MSSGYCHAGSYVCTGGYELRITLRCRTEDLLDHVRTPIEDLLAVPIVGAFIRKRSAATIGSKTVGPAAGERTLYHLGKGDDHRGATWQDSTSKVVWLCACGGHRSGEPDDAFPYFHGLIEAGRILPTAEDYELLERDRADRFVLTFERDAQAILARALRSPEVEIRGVVGSEPVAVVIEVVETLTDTYVAVSGRTISPEWLQFLLLGFYPERGFEEWETATRLPNRELDLDLPELCFRILHE